jgi:hypothetical protein
MSTIPHIGLQIALFLIFASTCEIVDMFCGNLNANDIPA